MSKMKAISRTSNFFFGLLLILFVLSCSSEQESGGPNFGDKVESPEKPTGEFKFYKEDNLQWSFKVLPGTDPTKSVITINSSTAQVNGFGNFYYQKKGEKQASVSCFFITRIAIGGNLVGQWNQYEISLTFISAHHGSFEGKMLTNPEDASGKSIKGMFVYDSELELEEIIDQYNEDNGDKQKVNWKFLCGKTWTYSGEGYSISYYFSDDSCYTALLNNGEVQKGSGKYTIDKETRILSLQNLEKFSVLELSENSLIILPYGMDKKQARKFVPEEIPSEMKLSISEPIVSFDNSIATIKGTVLCDNELDYMGVCWSLSPMATVYDYCVKDRPKKVLDKKIELASGFTYYMRLFAQYKDQYYYGKEITITVPGEKIENIRAQQSYWTPGSVKLKLEIPPYKMKGYGICWSKNPSPVITDNYLAEKDPSESLNQVDEWEIKYLERGTKYYVRAYHINGTDVVYYPGEFEVQTLGLNRKISLDLEYDNSDFQKGSGTWMGLQKNLTYNMKFEGFDTQKYSVHLTFYNHVPTVGSQYGQIDDRFYFEGPEDSYSGWYSQIVFYSHVSGIKSCGSYFEVDVTDLEGAPVAYACFRCAWNYKQFVYNPLPFANRWFSESNDDSSIIICLSSN